MDRIIRTTFVVIAILSTVIAKCRVRHPLILEPVCGSDGKTYANKYKLRNVIDCLKEKNNATSVDLHLVHHWSCFIWEKYGIGTTSFILVSQIQTVSILMDIKCSAISLIFQITLGLIIFGVCLCKFYRTIHDIWRKEELFLTAMV